MVKSIKMKDIAAELDISVVSVSKALNNKEGISMELREKILQTANRMGYKTKESFTPNQNNSTIGIIIADYFLTPAPAFYWSVYEELVRTLKNCGYYSILEIASPNTSNSVPSFYTTKKVDGVIVVGYVPPAYLKNLQRYNMPLIMLDFFNENVKGISVMPDNNISTYKMTNYLIEQGHTKIGFVGNILASTNIMDRYLGYYKSLLEHRIPLREDWVIPDRGDDMNIFHQFNLPKEMPTAFVCNCDQTAYWLVDYLTEKGYKIPDDISITGFYNYSYATMCKPPLTTVNVDIKDLAYLAVRALLNILKYKKVASDIILAYGNIIKRHSVKAPQH